jgi:hypothetical protein
LDLKYSSVSALRLPSNVRNAGTGIGIVDCFSMLHYIRPFLCIEITVQMVLPGRPDEWEKNHCQTPFFV